MASLLGFWSYVHDDDEAEGGRIARLARDVASQFEMLTAEPLDLFLDKDAIKWGEHWPAKVDSTLASVAFFIPVMTPRYFTSPECRRELQFFARQANRLGIQDLVLPLHYVNVQALHDDNAADDLIALIRPFHWQDWRELRFADVSAGNYRKGVSDLAARLFEGNRQPERMSSLDVGTQVDEG